MWSPRRSGIIIAAALVAGGACSWGKTARGHQTTDEEARELVGAVTSGDVMRVESLLSSGVNPNVRAKRQGDELGPPSLPALDVAIGRGNQQMVQVLLEHGANPNAVSSTDILLDPTFTPLARAVDKGLADIAQMLIDKGADVNRGGTKSPLAMALARNDDRIVTMLVDNKKLDLSAALCATAEEGNLGIVQRLLARHPDLNRLDPRGLLPLAAGVRSGDVSVVQTLLDHGAMVDGKNRKGETPLMYARTLDVAKLLIARGADPMAQDNAGYTALMRVIDTGAPELTPLLLAGSAAAHTPLTPGQVNHTSKTGVSAIGLAAFRGDTTILTALLAAGADPNKGTDVAGQAPVVAAAKNPSAVTLLTRAGAKTH
jgi:ankyrin repeat protein